MEPLSVTELSIFGGEIPANNGQLARNRGSRRTIQATQKALARKKCTGDSSSKQEKNVFFKNKVLWR